MFEGKLPGAGAAHPLDRTGGGQDSLRAVSWPDLVSRFDAARELRAALGTGETAGEASFDPDSARHIAELEESKPDINLDALADGKAPGGIGRSDKHAALGGDPRK